MRVGFTFDDIALVPKYNNVKSRTHPDLDLSTWLTKHIKIELPLVPANMDTVIGTELAHLIVKNGGIPLFHRFTPTEQKSRWLEEFPNCFISFGLGEDQIKEIYELVQALNLKGVVLDVAHGHSEKMVDLIKEIKDRCPNIEVIAGNICTARAYHDLANAGADAIKVGIGPGAACTTRVVTGFGVPQFTAIKDCAEEAQHLRVPIIADGGIRNSKDMVLALAAGASTVMLGKLFSLTEESAAEKDWKQIRPGFDSPQEYQAKFRGQASKDFQDEYYGGLKEKTVAEGTDFWAPVSGSAQALINEFLGGLRSAMTYGGAKNIKEFQQKAEFMQVTNNYIAESNPRRD